MYELTAVRAFDAATAGQFCTPAMAYRFAEMVEQLEIQMYMSTVEHRFGGAS